MNERAPADRWRELSELFDLAVELDPDRRKAMLAEIGARDPALGDGLAAMLDPGGDVDRVLAAASEEIDRALAELEGDSDAVDLPVTIGHWRLISEIARGGMGIVYLGERADGQFEQRAAVKLIKRGLDTDEILARFLRERQILARLQHPSIAQLVDGGATPDGRPYFAMEYVEGVPVTAYCDARGMRVEDRIRLFLRACRALDFAHRNLVVHRDLKPSNILITPEGELKLLDFGIAKLLSADQTDDLTTSEGRVLTPAYAAPEQIAGGAVTTATDVYGLGAVLYELVTGRRPLGRGLDEPTGVLPLASSSVTRRTHDALASPESIAEKRGTTVPGLRRRLRGDLDAILAMALRAEPDRRYPTVEAFGRDLERWLEGAAVQARRGSMRYRTWRLVVRHRVAVAAAAIVAVAIVAGVAGTVWQARAAARQARKAEEVTRVLTSIFQVSDPSESRGAQVTAREILDRGAERIERDLAAQPDVQAELRVVIGEIYKQLGLLDRAAPLLERGFAQTREVYGSRSAEAAAAALRYGRLLFDRGDAQQSAVLLEEGLAVRRALGGAPNQVLIDLLDALGATYFALGRLEQSERAHREAYDAEMRLFGGDSVQVAQTLVLLGDVVFERQSAPDEAEAHARRAIDIFSRTAGLDHPDALEARSLLGTILRQRGRYAEAEPILREALADKRRVLGQDHPAVTRSLNSLAQLLEQTGRYEEAVAAARELLESSRRVLGHDHPGVVAGLNNFAISAYRLGRFADAEPAFREAVERWRRTLGPDHASTLSAVNNVGMTLRELGRTAEAERLVRDALAGRLRVLGEKSQPVAQSLRNLGLILTDRGAFQEAAAVLEQSLALSRTTYEQPRHWRVAEVLTALGRMRVVMGEGAAAEPVLREALDIRVEQIGAESPQAAETRMYLGAALCAAGNLDDGRTALADADASLVKRFGADDWRAAEARIHLASCLGAAGRAVEARVLASSTVGVLETRLGEAHYLTRFGRRVLARIPGRR